MVRLVRSMFAHVNNIGLTSRSILQPTRHQTVNLSHPRLQLCQVGFAVPLHFLGVVASDAIAIPLNLIREGASQPSKVVAVQIFPSLESRYRMHLIVLPLPPSRLCMYFSSSAAASDN
jgi:hypothetical protein